MWIVFFVFSLLVFCRFDNGLILCMLVYLLSIVKYKIVIKLKNWVMVMILVD